MKPTIKADFDEAFTEWQELRIWIHNYFGYKEDWVTIPLHDLRGLWWFMRGATDDKGSGGEVVFQYDRNEPFDLDQVKDGHCVSYTVYTQRFLPKWVFRGKDFTMISVATGVDGNKYLAIFSNDEEVPAELLDPKAKTFQQEMVEAALESQRRMGGR